MDTFFAQEIVSIKAVKNQIIFFSVSFDEPDRSDELKDLDDSKSEAVIWWRSTQLPEKRNGSILIEQKYL